MIDALKKPGPPEHGHAPESPTELVGPGPCPTGHPGLPGVAPRRKIESVAAPPTPPARSLSNFYLSPRETAIVVALVGSVAPRVVAEFGVNLGKTAKAILDAVPTIETYIGIDVPFGYRTRLACQQSEVPSAIGLCARDDDRFKMLPLAYGSRVLEPADLEPIDAAFIDGDHSEVGTVIDSMLARTLLRAGGIIVWHDYGNPGVEVDAALDRLAAVGWPIRSVDGTWLAFMRS
jgi:predicted O-methyltransferase YrrM